MNQQLKNSVALGAAMSALACAGAWSQDAAPAGVVEAIQGGKLILDLRPRYAGVDQTGFGEDASAFTLRTALGWETAPYRGVKALVEFEDVRALIDDYNSTTNGETSFPVEADPETTELNRAQLSWTNGTVTATGGRQRLIFDDQRFVGNVGWRQDEQTLDAARFDWASGKFALSYAYVWGVERVFAEAQDWDSESHLLNASFKASDALKLTGFVYALDFEQAAAMSTTTYGVAASGALPIAEGFKLNYGGVYANQQDYGDNPGDVDLNYYRGDLGVAHGPFTLTGSYEVLEGDGVRGFSTPLATLHAFQGWADVFLATPAAGIEDAFVTGRFAPTWSAGPITAPVFMLVYHDYEAEQTGADLGSEIDAQFTAKIHPRVTGLIKFADYDGPTGGPADRTKVWVGLQFTL